MRRFVCGLLFLAVVGVVGCGTQTPTTAKEEDPHPVADFSLTERSGRKVSREDLLGKVWVASFVFTRCAGPCPMVSGSMARLQHKLAGQKDVVLVTFTVDPEHDTPTVLREYAELFQADPERWLFLTGKQDEVYRLIKDSFQLGVKQAAGKDRVPGNEVVHSTRLVVVDRHGNVRDHSFDGTNPDDLPRLERRVAALLREAP
jgi:cytochrome oxidase Cu insertion factor (SCO1/SenC/PrrC family)